MTTPAFDQLLHNAHRAFMAECDLGLGKATNWRAITALDVLDAARELYPELFAAREPQPQAQAHPQPSRWRQRRIQHHDDRYADCQCAAANDMLEITPTP